MAIDNTNVLQTSVSAFFEGMIQPSDSYTRIFDMRSDDVASLRLAALTGIPDPSTWDGAEDLTKATLDSTGAVTMSYQGYGVQVRIGKLQARDIPGVVEMASRKLGRSVASKRAALAWAHLETAFTAGDSAIADGKALCASDHTTVLGGGNVRSNLAADSILDRSAFLAMLKQAREAVNYQNQINDWADAPKFLVVPPELETAALEIVGSPFSMNAATEVGTANNTFKPASVQGEINTAGRYNTTVLVSPYLATASDYFLICDPSVENPLTYWTRSEPDFRVDVDSDSGAVKLSVDWASATQSGPQPDGIIGCNKS
mgnify:CR=1 FL=1|tara:strand:- start:331 stop:1278 length:948 start_codon:yes stop_codon:yes gene_type:complete